MNLFSIIFIACAWIIIGYMLAVYLRIEPQSIGEGFLWFLVAPIIALLLLIEEAYYWLRSRKAGVPVSSPPSGEKTKVRGRLGIFILPLCLFMNGSSVTLGQDLTLMPQTAPVATPVPVIVSHPPGTIVKPAAQLIAKHHPAPPVDFLVIVMTPSVEGGNVANILRGTTDLTTKPVKWQVVGAGKTNRFVLPNNRTNQFFQAATVITNL